MFNRNAIPTPANSPREGESISLEPSVMASTLVMFPPKCKDSLDVFLLSAENLHLIQPAKMPAPTREGIAIPRLSLEQIARTSERKAYAPDSARLSVGLTKKREVVQNPPQLSLCPSRGRLSLLALKSGGRSLIAGEAPNTKTTIFDLIR